jgi:hypothetical protein
LADAEFLADKFVKAIRRLSPSQDVRLVEQLAGDSELVAEVVETHSAALIFPGDCPDIELILVRPAWMAHAACRRMGVELFFPEQGQPAAPAQAICGSVAGRIG